MAGDPALLMSQMIRHREAVPYSNSLNSYSNSRLSADSRLGPVAKVAESSSSMEAVPFALRYPNPIESILNNHRRVIGLDEPSDHCDRSGKVAQRQHVVTLLHLRNVHDHELCGQVDRLG